LTDVSEVITASIIRVITSETSVNIYETTRRNVPEDSYLHECEFVRIYESRRGRHYENMETEEEDIMKIWKQKRKTL
jgi:hypothetical protein